MALCLFAKFNSTNQGLEAAVPVLLVDGYNVCGYWAKLKKHFSIGRLDIARQKLIDELVTFSLLRGFTFFPFSCVRFEWYLFRDGVLKLVSVIVFESIVCMEIKCRHVTYAS